jgi:hypothetical protein
MMLIENMGEEILSLCYQLALVLSSPVSANPHV